MYWLEIAHHLHLTPREQEELTVLEWAEAVAAVDAIREEASKQQ